MSTPPSTTRAPRASAAVRYFVPGYLLVFGLVLFAGAAYLFANYGDELFVAGLSFAGGLTMWLTALAMLTVGRRD
jgi:hypothetical protein